MFEVENDSDRRNDPALVGYLRNIARYPLLTHQEETDLARRVRQLGAIKQAETRLVETRMQTVGPRERVHQIRQQNTRPLL